MKPPPHGGLPSMAAALPALVAHDVKNALGVLEAQLARLIETVPAAEAREAHAQCVALRQRLVMMLTLYPATAWQPVLAGGDPHALPVLRTDEAPVDFLCSVERRTPRPRRDVELTVGAAFGSPPCWTFDPHLVRLALDAALHNAWRFARRHVHLDARGEPGYLVLTVDDDGPGPAATQATPAADEPRSTGLGLALCDAVARAHGSPDHPGRVSLAIGPTGGARFELWLA
jgi:signal transduction histidine kinase